MSDDHKSVSLDMLETRLRDAENDLVSAIKKRATAGDHMRAALKGNGDAVAMGVLTGLERLLRQSARMDDAELMLRWNVEFQVDMFNAGLQKVIVSGSEPLRIWDQARNMFGHAVPMQFDKDQRENLTLCADSEGTVGVMGWMTSAGSGQWWPILNETRYHDLRIIGAWPIFSDETPYAAIVAKGPLAELDGCRTLMIAHDDHHKVERIFAGLDLEITELSRARTLVLFEAPKSIAEDDPRLAAARTAGLDGLRVVGSLPGANPTETSTN